MPLVECVPNFSEGRRPEVIDEIVGAIARRADGVHVLDRAERRHAQPLRDHLRRTRRGGGPAAFGGIAAAARLIDLHAARGRAPAHRRRRRGALRARCGTPTCRCASSWRAASRVAWASELEVPAYLYEDAALRPEHRDLAEVRRGEFEGCDAVDRGRRQTGARRRPPAPASFGGRRRHRRPSAAHRLQRRSRDRRRRVLRARSPSPSASATAASARSRPWGWRSTTACRSR